MCNIASSVFNMANKKLEGKCDENTREDLNKQKKNETKCYKGNANH